MELIPALDFYENQCVRLFQGDFNKMTPYDLSPVQWAKDMETAGADRLHLVNLKAALEGQTQMDETLWAIRKAVSLPIEVGGGIRSFETAKAFIDAGFDVILGTLLTSKPATGVSLIECYGDRVIAGVDVLGGQVMTHGWLQEAQLEDFDFLFKLETMGFQRAVYTDISKDGSLLGPNISRLLDCQKGLSRLKCIASGGVGSLEDLVTLKRSGISGVVVGKALLEGRFRLEEAVERLKGVASC